MTGTLPRPDTFTEPVPDSLEGTGPTDFAPEVTEVAAAPVMPKAKPKPRFELIDANSRWFVWVSLVVFATILAASIVWSFSAIVEMP